MVQYINIATPLSETGEKSFYTTQVADHDKSVFTYYIRILWNNCYIEQNMRSTVNPKSVFNFQCLWSLKRKKILFRARIYFT